MHGLVRRTLAGDSNSRCLCSPLSGHQSTLTVPNPPAASSDVFTPVHGSWRHNRAELQPAFPRRAQDPSGSPGPAPAWVTRDMRAGTMVGRRLRSPGAAPRAPGRSVSPVVPAAPGAAPGAAGAGAGRWQASPGAARSGGGGGWVRRGQGKAR